MNKIVCDQVVCDQVVRCMDAHNKYIPAQTKGVHNDVALKAYMNVLLNNGITPVVVVKENDESLTEYEVKRTQVLDELAAVPYHALVLIDKNGVREQYTEFSVA